MLYEQHGIVVSAVPVLIDPYVDGDVKVRETPLLLMLYCET